MGKESSVQKTFVAGLLMVIPLAVTIAILGFLFNLLDAWLTPSLLALLRLLRVPLLSEIRHFPGLGILATMVLIFVIGLVSKNYIGRKLLAVGHGLMKAIPIVNNVYGGVVQLVKAFSSASGSAPFKTVVMLEFPRRGIWTIGFVSSESFRLGEKIVKSKLINVFVPAAPIPSQGLFIMVPIHDVKVLPMSMEEAFKMLATLGVVQTSNPQALLMEPKSQSKKRSGSTRTSYSRRRNMHEK